ncbi:AraC family transcriptional regulator [Clostridium oryzae]|uniref:Transposon Tn10 TetD protein n=1 Tax=Clostridium oryzae TaxID=1450648 RepID=A0A1V4IVD2_9CLOT|nr:AraC family transcriptional regulator [Clostridium oryzae]OPJ64018.1 transposon Tn10 TetD protein [Clostridium oryzae]
MKWLKQMSGVIDYIENNLTGDISYDEAAKLACCSTYYFQRMFSYITDISVSEYIRRRRMTEAAFELQQTKAKVMEIALKYGYESPTAFNRAFQSVHGISPTAARVKGVRLNAYLPISFSILVKGSERMSYRIETKEAMKIVGYRIELQESMEENQKLVPMFWSRMLESGEFLRVCELTNKAERCVFGVTSYENHKDIYYYVAAQTDKPTPEDMFELEIPAATWVVFEGDGHFKESVQSIFKRFLTEWLPASGYEYAELPDIEVYPVDAQGSKSGHAEVWISIKKE